MKFYQLKDGGGVMKKRWEITGPDKNDQSNNVDRTKKIEDEHAKRAGFVTLGLAGFGFISLLVYSFSSTNISNWFTLYGTLTLVGGASFLTGNLAGLIFGIPKMETGKQPAQNGEENDQDTEVDKVRTLNSQHNKYQVNTNLQEVSDWLTKILLGLGLAHIYEFPGFLGNIGNTLTADFANITGAETAVIATIIHFFASGFLGGYLLTRLYLTGALQTAEQEEQLIEHSKAIERLELKQKATADIEPTSSITDILPSVEKLINLDDVYGAISIGRRYLQEEQYEKSLAIFAHLTTKLSPKDRYYYKVYSNFGYSLIGYNQYEEAIKALLEVKKFKDGSHFKAWHAVALAYAYYKLGDNKNYNKWLMEAKTMPEFRPNINHFINLYTEIERDLIK